jgi:hypothetical protein
VASSRSCAIEALIAQSRPDVSQSSVRYRPATDWSVNVKTFAGATLFRDRSH